MQEEVKSKHNIIYEHEQKKFTSIRQKEGLIRSKKKNQEKTEV